MIPIITNWESSAAALLYDLLNVPAKELENIIGDYLWYYRLKNLARLNDKFQKQKEKKRIMQENMRTVSPKLGIPLLDAASLEEDDVIQDIWARLLLNAAYANFTSEIRVAFIDIIKTLTPIDAQILRQIYNSVAPNDLLSDTSIEVHVNCAKAMNDLKIDALTCGASLDNLERCQLISRPAPRWNETDEDENIIKNLTALGILFIRACIGGSNDTSKV
ncbi:MAG: DUF4393 domain-containing protein [Synergistaceae bacterium]|nr:DUF4393 domain-containing protein [Synergistaceae bacterium]